MNRHELIYSVRTICFLQSPDSYYCLDTELQIFYIHNVQNNDIKRNGVIFCSMKQLHINSSTGAFRTVCVYYLQLTSRMIPCTNHFRLNPRRKSLAGSHGYWSIWLPGRPKMSLQASDQMGASCSLEPPVDALSVSQLMTHLPVAT
jgi:hypothetical protein